MGSEQQYAVAYSPVQVFPAGLQGALTVFNNGAAVIYATSAPNSSQGIPISAGNSVQWLPDTPLFLHTKDEATTGAALVFSGAVTLPQGSVIGRGDAVLLYSRVGGDGVDIGQWGLDVSAYATVYFYIVTERVGAVLPAGEVRLLTIGSGSATFSESDLGVDLVGVPFPGEGRTSIEVTRQTRGKTLSFELEVMSGWKASVYVMGLTANFPRSYALQGQSGTRTNRHGGLRYSKYVDGVIVAGTGRIWLPPVREGRARLSVTTTAPTNTGQGLVLSANTLPVLSYLTTAVPETRIWGDTIFESLSVVSRNYDLLLPPVPLQFTLNNQTGVAQNPLVAIIYE